MGSLENTSALPIIAMLGFSIEELENECPAAYGKPQAENYKHQLFKMLFPIQEQGTTRSVLGTGPREGKRPVWSRDGSRLMVV